MAGVASIFDRAFEEVDLIERHIEMLKVTKEKQPIGIIKLSEVLGIPKHKVRYSLRLLEQEGLIIATNDGAMVSDKYEEFMEEVSVRFDELIERINKIKQK
ncbi:hypothetical protein Mpt1_c13950 [Candidatus Methanoplasma termitum]|uniref:Winged helix-turn-helix transcriptional regulator n=1 Tax=Candidatus Methanoplasma termitum TaxID=1577791 RepID=A0A0A7LE39_9ARCH|nr:hypothetical protein [Candidatus Methanoplasma termitum]AIZ57253.1 hypothetical protein Mpt1_c13950 [Candidatus Methanoplasma termitum]MCL2334342.1 hypothetical protein [Candidatus Methanoplasma sp.]